MAPGCNGNPELPGCRRFDSAPTDSIFCNFFFSLFLRGSALPTLLAIYHFIQLQRELFFEREGRGNSLCMKEYIGRNRRRGMVGRQHFFAQSIKANEFSREQVPTLFNNIQLLYKYITLPPVPRPTPIHPPFFLSHFPPPAQRNSCQISAGALKGSTPT